MHPSWTSGALRKIGSSTGDENISSKHNTIRLILETNKGVVRENICQLFRESVSCFHVLRYSGLGGWGKSDVVVMTNTED